MTRMVGVDIGASAVRVVEVTGMNADGYAQVSRIGITPLKAGAVVAGRIKDHQVVAWALTRALKEAGVAGYGVVLGLATPDAAIARLVMPGSVRRAEWRQVLRLQERSISPKTPLSDSAVSINHVRADPAGDGMTNNTLLVGAALRSEIDSLLAVCKLARVTPRAIDLAGAASMRALTRTVPGNEDVATLVDVGHSKLTVATRQGLHLRNIRTSEGGGDKITRAILGVTDGDYAAAERQKMSLRVGSAASAPVTALGGYGVIDDLLPAENLGHSAVDEALTTAAEQLVDDIAAALESDAAQHTAITQGISLCGGTALLRGLKERLNQRVGVPVQIGRPWAVVERNKRNEAMFVDGVEDPVTMLSLTTAIGLALWKDNS